MNISSLHFMYVGLTRWQIRDSVRLGFPTDLGNINIYWNSTQLVVIMHLVCFPGRFATANRNKSSQLCSSIQMITTQNTKCLSGVDVSLPALKNQSTPVSGSTVWLLTANDPSEATDLYRQMCLITTFGHGTILLDFLDLSYNDNVSRGKPYCVYWGESDFVCATKASGRQTFEVRNSSGSQNSQLTLLFWSNDYIRMPTARFWIEIRGSYSQYVG